MNIIENDIYVCVYEKLNYFFILFYFNKKQISIP